MTDPACRRMFHRCRAIGMAAVFCTLGPPILNPTFSEHQVSGQVVSADETEAISSLRQNPVVLAVRDTKAAVVDIKGNKTVKSENSRGTEVVHGMGTGIIIDSRGYIITNLHVVQDVAKIEVSLYDGTETTAKLLSFDTTTDLALIKIPSSPRLRPIPIGRSHDLEPGETVIAIGNPYGYEHSVTVGYISGLGRTVSVNGTQDYSDLIQTSADINPGNSGGPLINIEGKMIGINVAVRMGAQGIGFAIPIDNAMDVIADLVLSAHPDASAMSVSFDESFVSLADGARSVSTSDSNTSQLLQGDRLLRIDGRPISHRLDLTLAMIGRRSGDRLPALVERDGAEQDIDLLVGAKNPNELIERKIWEKLGLRLAEVTTREMGPTDESYSGGLRVVEIREGSAAADEPIRVGDILVGFMSWKTASFNDLNWVLSSSQFSRSPAANLFIVRDRVTYQNAMTLTPGRTIR